MSGSHDPTGYSTDRNHDGTAAHHHVILAPTKLDQSITRYKNKLDAQPPLEAGNTLRTSVMGKTNFGQIPNADHITAELQNFITSHAEAMESMGIVLDDFIARVQAAAGMARQADNETQAVAASAEAVATVTRWLRAI